MANSKISQLDPAVLPLENGDLLPIVQVRNSESTTNKISLEELKGSIEATMYYGSMYASGISQSLATTTTNLYVKVLGGTGGSIYSGLTNTAFSFQNNGELNCNKAGVYLINWSLTVNSQNNPLGEFAIQVNDAPQAVGIASGIVSYSAGGRPTPFSSTGILQLNVNDVVCLVARNKATSSPKEFILNNLSLTAIKLG